MIALQRIKLVVSSVEMDSLNAAIFLIRQRQVFIMIFPVGIAIIYILIAANAIPWTWEWVLLATVGPDTFGMVLFECAMTRTRISKEEKKDKVQDSEKPKFLQGLLHLLHP